MDRQKGDSGFGALWVDIPSEARTDLRRGILRTNVHRQRYITALGLAAALVLVSLSLWAPEHWFGQDYHLWHTKLLVMRSILGASCLTYLIISAPAARGGASNRVRLACDLGYRVGYSLLIGVWLGVFTPLMQAASFYLLGVLMMAVFMISTPLMNLATFGLCLFTGFASMRYLNDMPGSQAAGVMVNVVVVTILAMAASYYVYVKEVRDFLQNRTIARQNRELERYAMIDGLTGVANRRRLDMYLDQQWTAAAEKGEPLALILADIDFFKAFNDTKGHLAGDDCLKEIAQALHRCANRQGDLVARYGGEEFAAVLPGVNIDGAMMICEHMRRAVRRVNIRHDAASCGRMTISLGAAAAVPAPGDKLTELIAAADKALYLAKEQGRDQAVAA